MAGRKLEFYTIVMSYVADLTDPDAAPIDIAWLTLAEMDQLQFLVFVQEPCDGLDPFAEAVLEGLPAYVDQQLKESSHLESLGDIVQILHGSLRNSVYVSSVKGPRVVVVDDEQAAREQLVEATESMAPAPPSKRSPRVRLEQVPRCHAIA